MNIGTRYDATRLHNILNTLVIEARRDLNPETCPSHPGKRMYGIALHPPKAAMKHLFSTGSGISSFYLGRR